MGLLFKVRSGYYAWVREGTLSEAHRNSTDSEIFAKAIRAYCADPDRNIRTLMHYARTLHLEEPTQQLIGIWL